MELMEDLDPEEARAIVDPALRLMIDAVHRYDGYIVQSTGDGIFALFGAPVAHEDHPQRALYAALRMQEDIRRYAEQLRSEGKPPLQVRVGANTGEAVVRSIRTGETHAEYTPIGHSTSLAARMQVLAPIGSIAITGDMQKLVEGYFQTKSLGPTRVKGVSDPVNVYEVTGMGPLRTRLQVAARRGLTKFVGREAELAQMRRALEATREGHGQLVAAMGEPGVGKSRLFFEFKAVAQSGCLVLEAYSVSHGKASAYLPVIDLLKSYFEIAPEDDERKRREKVAGKVLMLERSLEDTLPYLFALLAIEETAGALAQMDAQIRRRRTLEAIKRLLLRESLNRPLIVEFEDLHWIDGETQALLDILADAIANARVLMLVNYRPEYRHQWGNRGYYTQLRLDPLGKDSAEEMLAALLGSGPPSSAQGSGLPLPDQGEGRGVGIDALKRLIIERTEGNPFFMEEMVQVLFDQGALVRNGAVRLTTPLGQLRIPPTVQGILTARIDRLPSAEKQLLQTLAVIGREFPLPLVRGVTQLADDELERMLAGLQTGEFIYEQPAIPDVEYTFKHALTQEVAYNSVLTERRKLLHGQIGAVLEALHSGHLEDHLGELAHHYSRSGNAAKAVEYLRWAAEQTTARSAYQEAANQLNMALGLLENLAPGPARDGQELALRMALVLPIIATVGFRAPGFKVNLERAHALCSSIGDTVTVVRVLHGLRTFYFIGGEFRIARELGKQMLEIAARNPDDSTTYIANFAVGSTAAWMGELRFAREHVERALTIDENTINAIGAGGGPPMPAALATLSYALWMLGYPDQALREEARMKSLLSRPVNLFHRAGIISSLLLLRCHLLRDYQGMRQQAEAHLALAREIGFTINVGSGLVRLGRILVEEKDFAAGIETMREGMRVMDTMGAKLMYTNFCCALAEAYLAAGRPRGADRSGGGNQSRRTTSGPPVRARTPSAQRRAFAAGRRPGKRGRKVAARGDRNRAAPGGQVVGAARRHQPGPPAAQAGQDRRGPRDARGNLRLVYRRLRHRRPQGRQGAARRVESMKMRCSKCGTGESATARNSAPSAGARCRDRCSKCGFGKRAGCQVLRRLWQRC